MEQRTCPVCQTGFEQRHPNQRFCPPTDDDRSRVGPNTQPRSSCAKAYENARHRGTLEQLLAKPHIVGAPFACELCGKRCVPGENVASHARKFCGKGCKKTWHTEHEDGANRRWAEAHGYLLGKLARRRRVETKLAKAAAGLPRTVECWTVGPCVECGELFVSSQWATIACCGEHAKRNQQRRANRRRAALYGWNDSNRARARRYGVAYETIRVRDVFERDGYRCGICREFTKRSAKVPDLKAPTLDHIIPISRGGPHLYVNVQCACFKCNCRKGDGAANDQLLLVG